MSVTEQPASSEHQDREAGGLRLLRRQARQAEALARRVNELEQELAFRDSGLTLSDDQRHAVLSLHGDDDLTAEAVVDLAGRLAFVDPPQVPAGEIAAQQRAQEAMAGAEAADAHVKSLNDLIAEAKSPEQVAALLRSNGFDLLDQ